MKRYRAWHWWSIALRGVAAILLGLFALFLPGAAFVGLVMVFGAFAIVDGALALAMAVRAPGESNGAIVMRGLASVLAGAIVLVWPGISAIALLFVIAAWAVASGILEIFVAIKRRKQLQREWLLVLDGALSIVFGVLLFLSPLAGAIVLGIWLGIYALVLGTLLLVAGFRVRSREKAAQPPTGAYATAT